MGKDVRLTKKAYSWETGKKIFLVILWWKLNKWIFRQIRPILYHPLALLGLTLLIGTYLLSPWATAALFWALLVWQRIWPYHYRDHVQPRISSFLAGHKYRHHLRKKLKANGLLNDDDPTPVISRTTKQGCTTTIHIKMSYGDDIQYWRERSTRIAQTFNAERAIINPYRRPTLNPRNNEKTTKYRWLKIDFLTRDPFAKPVGIEYIHQYRIQIIQTTNQQGEQIDTYKPAGGDPLGPSAEGTPYMLDSDLSLLNVSITGGGKSNAERTYIFTGYREVLNHTKENWGCDLARGVELNPIKHVFARLEDGKKGPEAVLQFWEDARNVLWQRLDDMEADGINLFIPTPGKPALDIYFDEAAILETIPYAPVRKAIYAAQSEILLGGRKCKIRIFAFTQRSKLDQFPLRDDFPQTHLGRVKTQRQVAMATDYDFYDRGGRANDINPDQPGIYYAETQSAMAPTAFRFTETTLQNMQQLPPCPPSVLWKPPPAIEQIFTSLPVEAHPQPQPIPAAPQQRRLHLNASRRPKQRPAETELEPEETYR